MEGDGVWPSGLNKMRLRPWLEVPSYLVAALLCAWFSNTFAGPTRRLSWWPKESVRPAASSTQIPSAASPLHSSAPSVATPALPLPKTVRPAAESKVEAPRAAPAPDPKTDWWTRFPPLVNETQADIRGDEAAWLHAHGARFVDARRTSIYTLGHISGAKNLPAWEDGLPEKVDQLTLFTADLKVPVVVYCSGGDCHDSHLVAQKLWLAGFRNLRIYVDGFPDWEARKLPVTQGEKP